MKRILLIIIVITTCTFKGVSGNADSLRFEVLITRQLTRDANIIEPLINSIDLSSDRLIVVATQSQFYMAGWGGMIPLGKKTSGKISSFAFTPDHVLMAIRSNELVTFDSLENLIPLYKLPGSEMGIATGKYLVYIFSREVNRAKYPLYGIAPGGKYTKLLDLPSPINAVCEVNNALLLASENALFRFDLKNKDLKALCAAPKGMQIKSIAPDTVSGMIFFSTETSLFAFKNNSVILVSREFAGTLKVLGDGLLVFNPAKNLLIRILGLEQLTTQPPPAPPPPPPPPPVVIEQPKNDTLTNTSIVNMVQSQLSDEMIISIISKSQVNFNMSVDSMIYLSNQNVSSAVIRAMKNAMKKQTEATPK